MTTLSYLLLGLLLLLSLVAAVFWRTARRRDTRLRSARRARRLEQLVAWDLKMEQGRKTD